MTKKKTRTQNSAMNFITGIGGQLLNIILQFIVRTVFIHTLGKEYLGVNGVFSNILSMLSLAEFGFGSAILFKLYSPLASSDHYRISILMGFYKTVYRIIGLVVAIIGCILIPFLPYIAKDYESLQQIGINGTIVFLLYLFQSVSSYLFFAYKSAIIKADQREYIINVVKFVGSIFSSIIQILVLYTTKNFTIYIVVLIARVIIENLIVARIADKQYPYILEKSEGHLERKEIKETIKDCSALFLYKLNDVVLKATDNLVLSVYLGFGMVGLYSNYYIFYTTITAIFTRTFGSIVHSLGNLHAVKNAKHEYLIFKEINLITALIGGTAGVGIAVVADEMVGTWIGTEWVIMQPFSILMGVEVYTLALRQELSRYRHSMGLFQQAKFRPLIGMIINLVASVLLVKCWGICGVLAGTIISDWLTVVWYDPWIVHKYGLRNEEEIPKYYLRFLKNTLIVISVGWIDSVICKSFFVGHGWFSVAVHIMICALTVPIVFLLLNCKTEEVKGLLRHTVLLRRKRSNYG